MGGREGAVRWLLGRRGGGGGRRGWRGGEEGDCGGEGCLDLGVKRC